MASIGKVFRNSSGFTFNVSFVDCTSVFVKSVLVQSNRCNLQYIGETKQRLKDRFNEHNRIAHITLVTLFLQTLAFYHVNDVKMHA